MKKITAFLLALTVMTSAASCSGKSEKNENVQSFTTERLKVAAYKKENLTIPSEMRQIYTFMPYNGGNDYLLLGTSTRTPEFWHANKDFTEYEIVEFPEFDIGKSYCLNNLADGRVALFVNHADYGDLPPIGLYEYPEDYDSEKYDAAAEYKFMIKTYSPDGELLTSADVGDFGITAEKSSSINNLYAAENFVIAVINGGYEMFDYDGKYLGEFTTDEGDVDAIALDGNGKLVCAVTYKEDDVDKMKLCNIDEKGKLSEFNSAVYDFDETVQDMLAGTGEYSLLIRTRSSIYGIRADNNEIIPLMDVYSSGASSDYIEGYKLMDDGYMAVLWNNFSNFNVEFKKFIPRSDEEMADIKTITVAYEGSWEIENYINKWNDEGNDFLVEPKKYDTNDELTQDVLSDQLPDILCFSRFDEIDFTTMDVFEDLYTFMDKEEVYNRDFFIPSVLKSCEQDGKLTGLCNSFYLDLGVVGKTKYLGEPENWTFEKKVDLMINPPIQRERENDSKYTRLHDFVVWEDWVDYSKAECNFTDESFIRYLKYCDEAEVIEIEFEEHDESYYESDEWREKMDRLHYLESIKFIEDKEIFEHASICTYENYSYLTRGTFGGEPISFVEGATVDCSPPMSISKKSENKELAWEFIKSRITDDIYLNHTDCYYFFPVTKSGLKIEEERSRNEVRSWDDTDYVGLYYSRGNEEPIEIGDISDEDYKAVSELINSAKPAKSSRPYDSTIYEIAYDEIGSFFHGECTAEECADRMQDRISIYLSEQYS